MRFGFDIDCEVFEKAGPDGQDWRIGGFVSTNDLDRQSETLLQEGLDFGSFLKSGFFNDNHDQATDAVLGYPTQASLRELGDGRKGWYVEGYLLKGYDRSQRIWDLAKALQKVDRKLGFSVEGSILERDPVNPKIVRKAIVREVAITRCPINTSTALNVLAKSLSAGSSVGDPGVSAGEGFPLRVESLEGKTPLKRKRKRMVKSEAVALIKSSHPAVTDALAEHIFELALRQPPATEE